MKYSLSQLLFAATALSIFMPSQLSFGQQLDQSSDNTTFNELNADSVDPVDPDIDVEYLSRDIKPNQAGVFSPGTQVKMVFEVKNHLTTNLQLVASKTSCGCSKVKVDKTAIIPNESAHCELTVDAGQDETDRTVQVLLFWKREDRQLPSVISRHLAEVAIRNPVHWSPSASSFTLSQRNPLVLTATNFSQNRWTDAIVQCDSPKFKIDTQIENNAIDAQTDIPESVIMKLVPINEFPEALNENVRIRLLTKRPDNNVWIVQDERVINVVQHDILKASPSKILLNPEKQSVRLFITSDAADVDLATAHVEVTGGGSNEKSLTCKTQPISNRWISIVLESHELREFDSIKIAVENGETRNVVVVPVLQ